MTHIFYGKKWSSFLLLSFITALSLGQNKITNGTFDSNLDGWLEDLRGSEINTITHDSNDGGTTSGSAKFNRQKQGGNHPWLYQLIDNVEAGDYLIIRYKYKGASTDTYTGKGAIQLRENWNEAAQTQSSVKTYGPASMHTDWEQMEYTHKINNSGTLKFILMSWQKPSVDNVEQNVWIDDVELHILKGMDTSLPTRMFNGNNSSDWGTSANWTGINIGTYVTGEFNLNEIGPNPNQSYANYPATTGNIIIARDCLYDWQEKYKSYTFDNIYVLEGATFTLDAPIAIATKKIDNHGTIEMRQSGNGKQAANFLVSQPDTDTGTGKFVVRTQINKAKSGSVKVSLITPPVRGVKFNEFAADTENQDLLNKSDFTGVAGDESTILFGPYTDGNGYTNYDSSNTIELTPGVGYRTALYTDDSAYDKYVFFKGTGINSTQTKPSITPGKWNLIGNPFASAVSLKTLIPGNEWNAAKLNDAAVGITYWDADGINTGGTPGFVTKTASDLNSTDLVIRPGQAFFIKAKTTIDSGKEFITFNLDTQTLTMGSKDLNRSQNKNQEFELALTYNEGVKTTRIKFDEQASSGLDLGYEGEAFPDAIKDLGIYTQIADGSLDTPFAVQTINNQNLDQLQLPLGVNAVLGTYTLSMQNINLPEGIEVILTDLDNAIETVLNKHDYNFTVTNGNLESTDRFLITFQTNALSTNNNELDHLQIAAFQNTISVQGALENNTALKVYDLQGRLVAQTVLSETNRQLTLNNSVGVYVVSLSNVQGSKTQKVILK